MNQLKEYRNIKKELEYIEEKIKKLQTEMYSPRTSILSDMPGGPGFNPDKMVDYHIKLENLKEKYIELSSELIDKQIEIENLIKDFNSIERQLIRYRYFEGLKWEKVFAKLEYGQRQTFRLHEETLKKLSKMEKMAHTGT